MLALTGSASASPLTWQTPKKIDGSNNFSSISCPSTTLCVAADRFGNIATATNPWSPSASWTVTHVDSAKLESVSCWSPTQCAAADEAGNVLLTANPTGGAGSWSSKHIAGNLGAISCPTEFFCAATEWEGHNVITSDNGGWPPQQWKTTSLPTNVYSRGVSCSSSTLCVVAGDFGYEATSTEPTAAMAGVWWEHKIEPNFPENFPLDGVSCVVLLCVTDNNVGKVFVSSPTSLFSSWAAIEVGENWMNGVSCGSPALCVAVTSSGEAVTSMEPDGGPGKWTASDIDAQEIVYAVSCVSTVLCVAADWNGNVIVGAAVPVNVTPPSIEGAALRGQTMTEKHGEWTNSPSGYSYQWQRCDGSGANCQAIGGATNQSYTPTEADAGSTIRVTETAYGAVGSGTPAQSAATGRVQTLASLLAFLPAPTNTAPPSVSGSAIRGRALTIFPGTWANSPTEFVYQWQRCDSAGKSCANIASANAAANTLIQADVGHRLRAIVTASNVSGSSSAVSAASALVGSVVEVSLTWRFQYTKKYTVVASLIVHGLPRGGHIEIACRGGGCPFSQAHAASSTHRRTCTNHKCKAKPKPHFSSEVSLGSRFKGMHLKPGARISVQITKPGWVGKSYLFTTRPGKPPREQSRCLASPGVGC
jgi:hypothetical protein